MAAVRCARRSIECPAPTIVATSLRSSAVSGTSSRRGGTTTDSRVGAREIAPLALDPGFVELVADRAARGERAVEVDAAVRDVTAQTQAQGLRGFEDDERIDGAARTGAHGRAERRIGLGVLARDARGPVLWRRGGRCGATRY